MIFNPKDLVRIPGAISLHGIVNAISHPCLNKSILKEFWYNFTYQSSELNITEREELIFSLGDAAPLPLGDCDYSINICQSGICISAKSENDLIYGFMTLIDRFRAVDRDEGLAVEADCCEIREAPIIRNRMVHFCIFPETELWELQRFIRFCGALKYTHVVLEFWGMLKFDCLAELSWKSGFTKDQIIPIISEANALGIEIIPMINHWGHASSGRVLHGKHVVLDQDPRLQTYFSEDGWRWDIRKPKVRELLKKMRKELIELCGKGHYFHIGCDEAYNFEFTEENMSELCDFINETAEEIYLDGRRAIVWGDMFLFPHPEYDQKNNYVDCNAPSLQAEQYMLKRLSRRLVIADWQYHSAYAPVETASAFVKAGFDCIMCPWDRGAEQQSAVISTVREYGLWGLMHTTWHTLSSGMPFVTRAAVGCWENVDSIKMIQMRTQSAALLRKVFPICGDYEKAGWSKVQVGNLW